MIGTVPVASAENDALVVDQFDLVLKGHGRAMKDAIPRTALHCRRPERNPFGEPTSSHTLHPIPYALFPLADNFHQPVKLVIGKREARPRHAAGLLIWLEVIPRMGITFPNRQPKLPVSRLFLLM